MKPKLTLNNYIFIKLDPENTSIKLRTGGELFVDTTYDVEKHATVTGEVFGMPSHLQYTGKPNVGMPWLTDMQIRIGDKVIVYYLSVLNALKPQHKRFVLEGKDRYVFISYEFIYAVIRDGKVLPINGYCLLDPCEDPSITQEKERMQKIGMELIVSPRRSNSHVSYAKVKYLGVANREYVEADHSDDGVDIAVDDVVVIRRTNDIPLQYELHQTVNAGVKLLRVQRRNVLAKM